MFAQPPRGRPRPVAMGDMDAPLGHLNLRIAVRLFCPVIIDVIMRRMERDAIYGNEQLRNDWVHGGLDPRLLGRFMAAVHRTCESFGIASCAHSPVLYEYHDVYRFPIQLVQLPVSVIPDEDFNISDYDFDDTGVDPVMGLVYPLYQTVRDRVNTDEYLYGNVPLGGVPALAGADDRVAALTAEVAALRALLDAERESTKQAIALVVSDCNAQILNLSDRILHVAPPSPGV